MKREILRKVAPYVGQYAKTRGVHKFQPKKSMAESQSAITNAVYAVVHEGGLNRLGYHYCYGAIRDYKTYRSYNAYRELTDGCNIDTKPLAILLQVQDKPELVNEEAFRHFIEWMLNYSPYRHTFVTKSVNRALSQNVVIVDADTASDTMAGAMISFRHGWENYYDTQRYLKTNLWWELAQKIDPTIAFAISHSLIDLGKDGKVTDNAAHSDHTALSGDDVVMSNFIKHKIEDDSDPWSERLTYSGGSLSDIWRHGKKPDISLKKVVSQALKDTIGDKKKVNPFASVATAATRYKLTDAVESISASINDIKEKLYA